ncbi:hypothetical protein PJ15_0295 [Acinetobacter sp. neg1]|uniref:hypothetical protein n=1 Tax=Acinetobacter sp. neg1 TaxID=1561068 RepID=UPI000541AF9B|nr:hypothetical protein [Acinetobacter sp. neg1]KHF77289.1 hypothetical protein PJ15_0295 [Acinetobacter sp. neg1]
MISDYVRMKKEEKKRINEISLEINRQRMSLGMSVIEDSKVLHEILDEAFKHVEVEHGKIKIK